MALSDRRPSFGIVAVMIGALALIIVGAIATGEWGFLILALIVAAAATVPFTRR